MKKTRIVFMGTPDFAVASLDALYNANYTIVGVITAPDKPAGRGRKINQSAVKKYAVSKNLIILQPTNLKSPVFLERLKSLNADLQVVVAFRMLPKQVWNMPRLGTFNLHASLLPDYRGAAPINWAVINGETQTGVTTFFINEAIDAGALIKQESTQIDAQESAGDLHDKLMLLGSKLVVETVEDISEGDVKALPQDAKKFKLAPKLNKDNCRINWKDSIEHIFNHIRGLSPYPGAWSVLKNDEKELELKIYKTQMIREAHVLDFGSVVTEKKIIKVAVQNGFINILELKLAGKRKMDAISLLNGFTFETDSKMI